MNKIEQEIKEIIVESIDKLVLDRIKLTDTLEDLGADSLHIVELVMQFENEFDIEIPDEDAESLLTVGDVKQYLKDNS